MVGIPKRFCFVVSFLTKLQKNVSKIYYISRKEQKDCKAWQIIRAGTAVLSWRLATTKVHFVILRVSLCELLLFYVVRLRINTIGNQLAFCNSQHQRANIISWAILNMKIKGIFTEYHSHTQRNAGDAQNHIWMLVGGAGLCLYITICCLTKNRRRPYFSTFWCAPFSNIQIM